MSNQVRMRKIAKIAKRAGLCVRLSAELKAVGCPRAGSVIQSRKRRSDVGWRARFVRGSEGDLRFLEGWAIMMMTVSW